MLSGSIEACLPHSGAQAMFGGRGQRASVGMRGTDPVFGMLDDLEMQAAGLNLAERAVEVDELSVAQYAEVELIGRLHSSVGRQVRVGTDDGLDLHGRLAAVGSDWLSVDDGGGARFVSLAAVAMVGGLGDGALPEAARPLTARLSLRSVLRGFAAERRCCAVHLRGGRLVRGVPERVGADFVELAQPEAGCRVTVPVAAIAVVQESDGRA
jgi:hypothetical protein